MKVVGSRTGEQEYFVEYSDGTVLWLGAKPNSDLDVLLSAGEEPPPNCDIQTELPQDLPFVENGRVHRVPGYQWLLLPAALAAMKRGIPHTYCSSYNRDLRVFNSCRAEVGRVHFRLRETNWPSLVWVADHLDAGHRWAPPPSHVSG